MHRVLGLRARVDLHSSLGRRESILRMWRAACLEHAPSVVPLHPQYNERNTNANTAGVRVPGTVAFVRAETWRWRSTSCRGRSQLPSRYSPNSRELSCRMLPTTAPACQCGSESAAVSRVLCMLRYLDLSYAGLTMGAFPTGLSTLSLLQYVNPDALPRRATLHLDCS